MRRLPAVLASAWTTALLSTSCATGASTEVPTADAVPASQSASSAAAQPTPTPTPPPELIGGGTELFPHRRFVGLYGHPASPALGALGEQGPAAAAQRAITLAKSYAPYSDEPVYPAFEIIATTASAAPGPDGAYSAETSIDTLMPYVEAAEKNGIYVVLDLQPGRTDFLTQAKRYEDLLKRPNVGLGLDPEWRLAPGQRHMQQVGSVSAAEINKTTDWLAQLTRQHDVPQKLVVLHQFSMAMIQNRAQLKADYPELALVLHADGHGTPELKKETWQALQEELPTGIRMAWKNFYDEDTPTFTPAQTYATIPKPWFVSYQ